MLSWQRRLFGRISQKKTQIYGARKKGWNKCFYILFFKVYGKVTKAKNPEIAAGWQLLAFSANAHLTISKLRSANFDQLRRIHNRRRLSFSWNGSDRRSSVQRTVIYQNRKSLQKISQDVCESAGASKMEILSKLNNVLQKNCKLIFFGNSCCGAPIWHNLNLLFTKNRLRLINSFGQFILQKASKVLKM